MRKHLVFAVATLSFCMGNPALAEQKSNILQKYLKPAIATEAPISPIKVDYTGSCGASYTCVSGARLNCPRNARPAEFLNPYSCFCEYANTCR